MTTTNATTYRFGPCELDEARRSLSAHGREIKLQPRVFDLLCYLVRHRERVVSKDELLDTLWPGTIVVDNALQRVVSLARAALAEVGLTGRAEALPAGLTTLELRLMELARCLATGPRLVLLDEPLAGLSGDGVAVMIEVIRGVRARDVTVVIIEHTMQALLRLADRLVVLDQGRRLAEGAPGVVTQEPAVIQAYLGKRWLARAGAR